MIKYKYNGSIIFTHSRRKDGAQKFSNFNNWLWEEKMEMLLDLNND